MPTLKDAGVFSNCFFDCVYDSPSTMTNASRNSMATKTAIKHRPNWFYVTSLLPLWHGFVWYTSYFLLTLHNKVKQVFFKGFWEFISNRSLITKQYKTLLTNNKHQKVNLAKVLFEFFVYLLF